MKIVIAPDSFKSCLDSPAAAAAMARGAAAALPAAEIIQVAMSDGGEGLTEAFRRNLHGEKIPVGAFDALGRPAEAYYVLLPGNIAVMEMAAASGIERLTAAELNPLQASTFGTGIILREIARRGVSEIIIGIGGSATVDGGIGMLQALGVKFYDAGDNLLPDGAGGGALNNIVRCDTAGMIDVSKIKITVACDVANPLCGENGAAAIFGPQKGATPEMVQLLDEGLRRWAALSGENGQCPGDGAAGGLGFALRKFLNGRFHSGAELLFAAIDFPAVLRGADLLITGEGCSDGQSKCGKLCVKAAEAGAREQVPAMLVSGALGAGAEELEPYFAAGVFAVCPRPLTLPQALAGAGENLERTVRNLLRARFNRGVNRT